ncbi:MAG TPA: aromatic ring-hydroxylating dioxygenase subunit alpha [Burkholderiales bacterium]|nr:aromatic ring-hydroxylating dioxygenase subunit alpha [Burkholderiales bacterium]
MRSTPTRAPIHDILEELESIESDGSRAPMLPRSCYTSQEFFEFEREAVFARSWVCAGRTEQIPNAGDYLAINVAGEPLIIVRTKDDAIHAMSAVCQHRGQVITCTSGSTRTFRCPLHFWSYDLNGKLIGAPRIGGPEDLNRLRSKVRLPSVRHELWHGFIFVNLDSNAPALAPSLAKLEPFWANYEAADLVAVPPVPADQVLPWNWKLHFENFTDAYHPEFVHRGTHDFAPSNHPDGGVEFTDMAGTDNAIVRTVPMIKSDGGMMRDGWGESAAFPPIATLDAEQRKRLTFAMIPPGMTIVFAPNAIAYQIVTAVSAEGTMAANDRVTGGGWLVPRSTLALSDFNERAAQVREGGAKIWAQDLPVNLSMQAGKRSRFMPDGIYGPLETTLVQFNAWLLRAYRSGYARPRSASMLRVVT